MPFFAWRSTRVMSKQYRGHPTPRRLAGSILVDVCFRQHSSRSFITFVVCTRNFQAFPKWVSRGVEQHCKMNEAVRESRRSMPRLGSVNNSYPQPSFRAEPLSSHSRFLILVFGLFGWLPWQSWLTLDVFWPACSSLQVIR